MLLFGIFAGLALLLACIGIYGVLAYLTRQRVPEIGVRMALGATAGEVTKMVLRQGLGMIFIGVGVGIFAALAVGQLLVHTVDGMQSTEPSTFIITIPILVVAALLASFGPARRASRIDPMSLSPRVTHGSGLISARGGSRVATLKPRSNSKIPRACFINGFGLTLGTYM